MDRREIDNCLKENYHLYSQLDRDVVLNWLENNNYKGRLEDFDIDIFENAESVADDYYSLNCSEWISDTLDNYIDWKRFGNDILDNWNNEYVRLPSSKMIKINIY